MSEFSLHDKSFNPDSFLISRNTLVLQVNAGPTSFISSALKGLYDWTRHNHFLHPHPVFLPHSILCHILERFMHARKLLKPIVEECFSDDIVPNLDGLWAYSPILLRRTFLQFQRSAAF